LIGNSLMVLVFNQSVSTDRDDCQTFFLHGNSFEV